MYANILDNLDEMEKFLETQNPPRLNHEEIENLNRPYNITNEETESIIKIFQQRKALDLVASLNSARHLSKN